MERVVSLCGAGCQCCPAVEVTQDGVTISEADNRVRLTLEQWNLLVEKIKSGELGAIAEMELPDSCC